MSLQEVVTVQDRNNVLLNRRELKVIIKNTQDARQQLPRYVMLRNMSKEDRKKIIDEEKATKLKAKQTAAAEAKGGRSKK